MTMSNKIIHLQMIEAVIERMAKNSFTLKGWSMTLVVAIFSFLIQSTEKKYILITYVPVIIFWFLDSYYLQLERKYKALYKEVARKNEDITDFNMDISVVTPDKYLLYLSSLFSVTEWLFYISIVLSITGLIFIIYF